MNSKNISCTYCISFWQAAEPTLTNLFIGLCFHHCFAYSIYFNFYSFILQFFLFSNLMYFLLKFNQIINVKCIVTTDRLIYYKFSIVPWDHCCVFTRIVRHQRTNFERRFYCKKRHETFNPFKLILIIAWKLLFSSVWRI